MSYNITNIKISLKTSFLCLDTVVLILKEKDIAHKRYSNFIVIRDLYTYIIFKQGCNGCNHVNITKLKVLDDIDISIKHLCSVLLTCHIVEYKRVVDNITASINLERQFNLLEITKLFPGHCSYNTEKFPGLFLKFNCGTIILFHTGKCILIGAKTESDIQCLIAKIANI